MCQKKGSAPGGQDLMRNCKRVKRGQTLTL